MLATLRAVYRTVAIVLITLFAYLALEVGALFARKDRRAWTMRCARDWARNVATACGVQLTKIGEPPTAPYFFVFNHLSYVDVIPLLAFLDRPLVAARHDFANWFGLGFIARRADACIWVHRTNFNAMPAITELMAQGLRNGDGLVMAPEATTTRGDKVYPFHGTLLEPAVQLNAPVHYCALRYETGADDPAAWKIVNWWEDISFAAHAWRLLHAKDIRATIHFGAEPISADNRKVLARELHAAVSAIYEPML